MSLRVREEIFSFEVDSFDTYERNGLVFSVLFVFIRFFELKMEFFFFYGILGQ